MTAIPKAKVWQSKKYLRFVASLECCVTYCYGDRDTVVPHHVEGQGRRGRDDLTIPACAYHHDVYHNVTVTREKFERTYSIDINEVIAQTQTLWLEAGNKAEWL